MDTRQVDQALAGLGTRKTQRARLPIRDKIRYLKQIQQPALIHAQRRADATRRSHRQTPIPEQPTANRGETTMNEITFTSASDRCSAWHLPATSDAFTSPGGRPCVVMAPGLSGTRDSLLGYAEGFAAAGMDALLFDYRGFGASGGSPRQLVSVQRQRQDYHAAVAAARKLPGVDPERIVLWGISYSGGHVVVVAARDKRVAATISVTPAMDGIPVLIQLGRNAGPTHLVRAAGNGLRDALRALTGRAPHLVPMVGEPGSNAIITQAGGKETYAAIAGPSWRNELCARTALEAGFNRPITFASRITCPLLVQVGTDDSICPPPAGRRAVTKAGPRAKLREYPIDHLDVYTGAWQERALADELDFLRCCF